MSTMDIGVLHGRRHFDHEEIYAIANFAQVVFIHSSNYGMSHASARRDVLFNGASVCRPHSPFTKHRISSRTSQLKLKGGRSGTLYYVRRARSGVVCSSESICL